MRDFEQELRSALSRRDPPPGFADRVVARLPARRGRPRWLALVAALLIAIVSFTLWQQQRQQRRIAAEKARAELIRALEITSSSLEVTRVMLQRQTEGRTI
jgi:hypothetical protein